MLLLEPVVDFLALFKGTLVSVAEASVQVGCRVAGLM